METTSSPSPSFGAADATSKGDLGDALHRVVGPAGVILEEEAMSAYCVDWRREFGGPALAVVRPKSTSEVADVVRVCAQRHVAIVPQGGNTSLAGASVPIAGRPQVVMNLSRLNGVRSIDPIGMTMEVEAGCVLKVAQEAALARGVVLPVSFAAEGSSQIGGVISTNAGGVSVLRHGMMRQRVLGLEAVLADGSIVNGLRHLHKDNAGYDWKQLLIGTEGTLGIVTAATLRLAANPKHRTTAFLAVPDPGSALELLRIAIAELGDAVTAFELVSAPALHRVERHFGLKPPVATSAWAVVIEAASTISGLREAMEAALIAGIETGQVADGVIAESQAQSDAIWSLREHVSEAEQKSGKSVKHDVSVPVNLVPEFIEKATEALAAFDTRLEPNVFGHVGDGNVHFNVLRAESAQRGAVNRIVHDVVARFRGSISAEHGIGSYRLDELGHYKEPSQLDLMRTIKKAFDPTGIFNPGKVVPTP